MKEPYAEKPYTYLYNLDGLRFLAFLLILANHTDLTKVVNGHSFFFLLTGFLLAYISINEVKKKGAFNLKRYLLRRYIRTLPIFYITVLTAFFVAFLFNFFLHEQLTTGKLWPFLLLIHNYFDQNILFPLANLWAMGVTEQFYLLLGIFFLLFPRFGWKHAILFTLTGVLVNILADKYALNNRSYSYNYITNFGAGLLLAVLGTSNHSVITRIRNHSVVQIILWYAVSGVILYAGFLSTSLPHAFYAELLLCLGYSYIILHLSFGKFQLPVFRRKWFQKLGKETFSMYCWHAFVLTGLGKFFGKLHINLHPAGMFIIGLAITIIIAKLSFRFLEQPIIAFKNRFSS